MMMFFLKLYRELPWFRGKLRIGKLFFNKTIQSKQPLLFNAHGVFYKIPNTIENLGIELLINGMYENDILCFLRKHVKDNHVFFDIGANIGSIALPVIKKKKGIQYHGFEASPLAFAYLQHNFEKNNISMFRLHNKLVHKSNHETMQFYQVSDLYGKSSMAPTYTNKSITVDSVSLDIYCEENKIERIDWMKVDVQGFELYVFEGMEDLLQQKRVENILFEFESWADDQAGIEIGAAKRFLESKDYVLFGIDGLPLAQSSKKDETMIWARPRGK
jgi:FkbM family methyltransferase